MCWGSAWQIETDNFAQMKSKGIIRTIENPALHSSNRIAQIQGSSMSISLYMHVIFIGFPFIFIHRVSAL